MSWHLGTGTTLLNFVTLDLTKCHVRVEASTENKCWNNVFLPPEQNIGRVCHKSGCQTLMHHHRGPDSNPGQSMWVLWWDKVVLGQISLWIF